MSDFTLKSCPVCGGRLKKFGTGTSDVAGDSCILNCFGAYTRDDSIKPANGKRIYWCWKWELNGEEWTPEEFDRWLKLRPFQ